MSDIELNVNLSSNERESENLDIDNHTLSKPKRKTKLTKLQSEGDSENSDVDIHNLSKPKKRMKLSKIQNSDNDEEEKSNKKNINKRKSVIPKKKPTSKKRKQAATSPLSDEIAEIKPDCCKNCTSMGEIKSLLTSLVSDQIKTSTFLTSRKIGYSPVYF